MSLLHYSQEHESSLTVEQQLELVRRDQEELEKRVRLIEDLIAALRREDSDDVDERWGR